MSNEHKGHIYVKADFSELNKFGKLIGNRASTKPYFTEITDDLSTKLIKNLKANTPRVSGKLQEGWDNKKGRVYTSSKGYSISIKNSCEYAESVNYGHPSHNRKNKGGLPYLVYNRIVTPIPHPQQDMSDAEHWVFGTFFVERTLEQLMAFGFATSDRKVRRQLQKWIGYCVKGK